MDVNNFAELKFLLELASCSNQETYLSRSFKKFKSKQRDSICQKLGEGGIVDFSQEIASVEIAPPGSALLKLEIDKLPISVKEFKILERVAKKGKAKPSEIKVTINKKTLKAGERDKILSTFLEKGLVTGEMKLKRQGAKVWLTSKGKDCLEKVNQYFFSLQQAPEEKIEVKQSKPTDEEILQAIKYLDREINSDNYLPIFHLRDKFQPPLSREELDQALYRLAKDERIELSALQEARFYTAQQIDTGIAQNIGGPLFFISIN